MVVVPAATAVASPAEGFIVATATFELLQVPPAVTEEKRELFPTQNESDPEILAGNGSTVTFTVRWQPAADV